MRVARFGAILVALAALLAGCSFTGAMGPRAFLENGTDVAVGVYVNGGWVGTYPPGAALDVPIGGHGGPPYSIDVRTPAGTSLLEMAVTADHVAQGGGIGAGSSMPCGELELWFGPTVERPPGQVRVEPVEPGSCP